MNTDLLRNLHNTYLTNLKIRFRRPFIDQVHWDERLIALRGARGVGKTTLLLQHILEAHDLGAEALYLSLDTTIIEGIDLIEVASTHLAYGGTHLYLDEVHKYPSWTRAIKTIYYLYPQLKVVISGSSILQLHTAQADLSRRMVVYDLPGLSFREYLEIVEDRKLDVLALNEILTNHLSIAARHSAEMKIMPRFDEYLEYGFYPFFLDSQETYLLKLINTINQILEIDLPYSLGFDISNIFKLRKLIRHLATQTPFQPNISKLAGSMELARKTITTYLDYLDKARLIRVLSAPGKSYSKISRAEKIYLDNTNLISAIGGDNKDKGTMRETFILSQLEVAHTVNFTTKGDFLIDDRITLEVGGKRKNRKQIYNVDNSYLAVDALTTGNPTKIPLWLFGFVY